MRKIFGLLMLLIALVLPVHAMQEAQQNEAFSSIDQVPEYYIRIAKQLSERQPFLDFFDVDYYPNLKDEPSFFNYFANDCGSIICRKCTKLALPKKDCVVLDTLSCNAQQFLTSAWIIHDLAQLNRRYSNDGIMLWMFDTVPMCTLDELKSVYEKIITEIQGNWQSSWIAQHPDMFHKESEDEWQLLVKKSILKDEFNLMRFLIDKFELEDSAECWNAWIAKPAGCEFRKEDIYLWVKKDAFDQFQGIFNLVISQ